MENMDWGSILTIVFGLATTVFVGLWAKTKGILGKVKNVAKEGYEAIEAVIDALSDDKLTAEEQVKIKKEATEAWGAIKALFTFKKKE
jgi:hypothetical protein